MAKPKSNQSGEEKLITVKTHYGSFLVSVRFRVTSEHLAMVNNSENTINPFNQRDTISKVVSDKISSFLETLDQT